MKMLTRQQDVYSIESYVTLTEQSVEEIIGHESVVLKVDILS